MHYLLYMAVHLMSGCFHVFFHASTVFHIVDKEDFVSCLNVGQVILTITGTFLENDVKPYHPRSIHSMVSRLILLMSMSVFKAAEALDLVMESAGLLYP